MRTIKQPNGGGGGGASWPEQGVGGGGEGGPDSTVFCVVQVIPVYQDFVGSVNHRERKRLRGNPARILKLFS
jgi:hypothetical protein